MPYYRTWELNDFPTPSGVKRIRVNAGRLGYAYGDAHPDEMCRLDSSVHVVVSVGETKKSRQNEKGLMVADAKEVVLEDYFAYTGTVNGSTMSETLGDVPTVGLPNSLLQKMFGGIAVRASGDLAAPSSAITIVAVDVGTIQIKKGDVLRIGGQGYTVLLDGEVTHDSGRVLFVTPAIATDVASGTLLFIRPRTYEVFFTTLNDDGTIKEPYFSGDVDPDQVTASDSIFLGAHTSTEQKRRSLKLTVDAAATRFASLTVRDLLHDDEHGLLAHPPAPDASTGDMVYGKFYAGHINGSDQYPTAGPDGASFFGKYYTEYAIARYDPTGPAPDSFPRGLHGIRIVTLLDRMAKVAGLAGLKQSGGAPSFTSAFEFWLSEWQQVAVAKTIASAVNAGGAATITTTTPHALATGDSVEITGTGQGYDHRWFVKVVSPTVFTLIGWKNDYSVTVHTGTVYPKDYRLQYNIPATSLCVIFQYLFGINPIDGTEGRQWPITWAPDKSLADCLTLLANQFGSTARTEIDADGNIWLVVESRREEAKSNVRDGDTVSLVTGALPKAITLATSSVEPRQLAKAAVKIKNTADTGAYYSPVQADGETVDVEIPFRAHRLSLSGAGLILNTKWQPTEQWRAFKIERVGSNPPVSDDDGWVGASLLYVYGYILYPSDYETQWNKSDKNFYCVNYVAIKGTGKQESANYFNTVIAAAQFFEEEFIHDGVVVRRSYAGAADDAGFLQTMRPGLSASWMEDEDVRLFRMDEVAQFEVDNRLEVTWISAPEGSALPPVVTAGEESGSTGGSSGSQSTGSTSTSSQSVVTVGSYSVAQRTVLFYDSSNAVRRAITMDVFSYADAASGKMIAQYGWCPSVGDAAGMVMKFFFEKAQHDWGTGTTESGDVEIVGISTSGVPDYFATFSVMCAAGNAFESAKSNTFRVLYSGAWSRRIGSWSVVKPLERTAHGRRIYGHGRFQVFRNDLQTGPPWVALGLAGTYRADWLDLADAYAPMSDKEITTYDGSIIAPAWVSTANYIKDNRVTAAGSIFTALLANTNVPPPNATYWKEAFLPLAEDPSYASPAPPTLNLAYARPLLTPTLTVNGSLRITVDFGNRVRVMSCTHEVAWGDSGQRFALDFRREKSRCRSRNGAADDHCVDLDISLLDFQWAQAGAPWLWQVLHRDDPADPALPPNLTALLYDVIVTLEPNGEDVS